MAITMACPAWHHGGLCDVHASTLNHQFDTWNLFCFAYPEQVAVQTSNIHSHHLHASIANAFVKHDSGLQC